MSNVNLDTEKQENLRTVYRELCSSYRAIDDFRTKLLGFLPLVTGTGLFFSNGQSQVRCSSAVLWAYWNLWVCDYAGPILL